MLASSLVFVGGYPALCGNTNSLVSFVYGLLGVLISHPFEVVRVRQQYGELGKWDNMSMRNVVDDIVANEGFPGFFRGLIPRTVSLLPIVCGFVYIRNFNGFKFKSS